MPLSALSFTVDALAKAAAQPPSETRRARIAVLLESLRSEAAAAETLLVELGDETRESFFLAADFDRLPEHLARMQAALHAANQQCDLAGIAPSSLQAIRKAHEDKAMASDQHATLESALSAADARPWRNWSPRAVAAAAAHIDARVFATESLPPHPTHKSSLDAFRRHLQTAATREILAAPVPASIEAIISTAYFLFYVYRDLNALDALLSALDDPRITRLASLWAEVSQQSKDSLASLKEITAFVYSGDQRPPSTLSSSRPIDRPSEESVTLVTELLQHHFRGPTFMTVIPSLTPFLDEIKHLEAEYSITKECPVLGEVGQKAKYELMNILYLCRGDPKGDPEGIIDSYNPPNNLVPLAAPKSIYGIPSSTASDEAAAVQVWDNLLNLPTPDNLCLHWILTRLGVVDDSELWDLSFGIVPRAVGEVGFVARPAPVAEAKPATATLLVPQDSNSGDWSDREEEDDNERVKLDSSAIVKALLVAGTGNAAPIAGLPGSTDLDNVDNLLGELGLESWDESTQAGENASMDAEDVDAAAEEYEKRFKALEAMFPKLPGEDPGSE
ncbi:hypothetical protein HDU98_003685 [Podochytrium sp. JEL0797]|nr:hypothetical protein HDU98_003685 [Podochytrium sp. JEL0797]